MNVKKANLKFKGRRDGISHLTVCLWLKFSSRDHPSGDAEFCDDIVSTAGLNVTPL
jgi:hypothetical protein